MRVSTSGLYLNASVKFSKISLSIVTVSKQAKQCLYRKLTEMLKVVYLRVFCWLKYCSVSVELRVIVLKLMLLKVS